MSVYYSGSLLAAGLASTLLRPAGWYWGPVGIYAGQVAYMWLVYGPGLPAGDPIIFPSLIAVAIFGAIPTLAGGLLGAGIGAILGLAFVWNGVRSDNSPDSHG